MFKQFFLPTDCKICYWGRMALVIGAGSAMGTYFDSYWSIAPFGAIAGLAVAAKWIVNKYS